MKLFRDNMFDPKGEITMFDFFKNSLEKQIRIRMIIKEIIKETNKHLSRNNHGSNTGRESMDFIRPYHKRHEFDCEKCGIA